MATKISKRIKFISGLLKGYDTVLDIGTDHGLLLKDALSNGYIKKGIASDINPRPLSFAKTNLKDMNVDFIVSDGFENITYEYDVCVITGMGSHLISKILDDATKDVLYILGPNDKENILREYLTNNRFVLVDEQLIYDKFFYQILLVKKGHMKLSRKELYIGKYLKNSDLFSSYLEYKRKITSEIIKSINDNDNEALAARKKELSYYTVSD